MKNWKQNFRGIVLLERDLVGKLEPKCDHDFSIPCRLKQNKRKAVLISSVLAFVQDIRFPKFWNEAKWHLFFTASKKKVLRKTRDLSWKKRFTTNLQYQGRTVPFGNPFSIVYEFEKCNNKKIRFFETHKVEVPVKRKKKSSSRHVATVSFLFCQTLRE